MQHSPGRTLFALAGAWFLLAPLPLGQTTPSIDGAAQELGVADLSLQRLELPTEPLPWFRVDVTIDGAVHELSFNLHSLRSDGFRLLVEDETGKHSVESGPVRTYRGGVVGIPGAVVAGSLRDDGLHALVRLGPDRVIGIQPVDRTGLHGVYDASDALAQDVRCGADRLAPIAGGIPSPDGGSQEVAQIGIDSDIQFYLLNGSSVLAAQADVEAIMNSVEAIYDAAVGILFDINVIVIRTVEPNPYSGSIFDRLDDLMDEWTSDLAAEPRDVAHLFSGLGITSGVIGVAYLDAVCNFDFGFGASDTGFTSTFTSRVGLVAHELGHNFGAGHCDGTAECKIMCSFLGGCAGDLSAFGPSATAQIASFTAGLPCLSAPGACGAVSYGLAAGNTTSLAATGPLSPGTSMTLVYANPASAPSGALAGISVGTASAAFGPGVALIDFSSLVLLTGGVSFGSVFTAAVETVPIPDIPGLAGQTFYVQAAHFPTPGAPITELSNGVAILLCP